jgi:hypothetical protein
MKKIIRLTESDLTRIVKRVINEGGYQGIKNDLEYSSGINNVAELIITKLVKAFTFMVRLKDIIKGDSYDFEKIDVAERLLKKSTRAFTKFSKLKKLLSLFEERGMVITKSDLGDYGLDIEGLLNNLESSYNEINELKDITDDKDLINDLDIYESTLNDIVELLYNLPD